MWLLYLSWLTLFPLQRILSHQAGTRHFPLQKSETFLQGNWDTRHKLTQSCWLLSELVEANDEAAEGFCCGISWTATKKEAENFNSWNFHVKTDFQLLTLTLSYTSRFADLKEFYRGVHTVSSFYDDNDSSHGCRGNIIYHGKMCLTFLPWIPSVCFGVILVRGNKVDLSFHEVCKGFLCLPLDV